MLWSDRTVGASALLTVGLLCLVGLVVWPWASTTLPWEDLPDATNHLVRILVVDAALGRGEWYLRWLSDLYLGYGYPLLNYYAPGLYYLGAGLHRLGLSIYQSLQVAGVLGVAAGASGAFVFARALHGRQDAGLLTAAAYVLAPYPFFTNLYVRGDVPEVLALGLLPWLLCAAWGAWQGSLRWSIALAALTASMVLTHNVTALFAMALLGGWTGVLILVSPPRAASSGRLGAIVRVGLAVATGLGLSAFFWLPALAEQGQVRMSLVQGGIFDFHGWLFNPLASGGGTALPAYPHTRIGPADLGQRFSYDALNLHAPEKIGLPQLLLWAGATAAALWHRKTAGRPADHNSQLSARSWWWPAARRAANDPASSEQSTLKDAADGLPTQRALQRPSLTTSRGLEPPAFAASSSNLPPTGDRLRLTLVWSAFAAGLWLLNTTWSTWLWERLPLLSAVQFPWRLYGPLALCVALAAGGALARLTGPSLESEVRSPKSVELRVSRRVRAPMAGYGLAAGVVVLMAMNAAVVLRPQRVGPPPVHDVDAQTLVAEEYDRFAAGTTSGGEFLPKDVDWPKYETGVWQGIRIYDQAFPEASWQAGLVRVLDGQAAVTEIVRTPAAISAQVDAETPTRLAFHQLLFAGWQAQIDGRVAPLEPGTYEWTAPDPPHELVRGTLGFMVVNVPAGNHRVEVSFGATPPRALGRAVSTTAATAVTFALAWSAWNWLRRHRVRRPRGQPSSGWAPAGAWTAALAIGLAACGASFAGGPARVLNQVQRATCNVQREWDGSARCRSGETLAAASAGRVALDIASAVRDGGDATTLAGPGHGLAAPFLDLRYLQIGGETRRWLYMHPPSSVSVSLRVPPHAYFQSGLALDPQTWSMPAGDGVRFIAEADTPSGHVRLLDQHVNPRARGEERRWLDVWVSLESLAGQPVRLTLRTDLADDPSYDWAGWANPQIVLWPELRPDPGISHKF